MGINNIISIYNDAETCRPDTIVTIRGDVKIHTLAIATSRLGEMVNT